MEQRALPAKPGVARGRMNAAGARRGRTNAASLVQSLAGAISVVEVRLRPTCANRARAAVQLAMLGRARRFRAAQSPAIRLKAVTKSTGAMPDPARRDAGE